VDLRKGPTSRKTPKFDSFQLTVTQRHNTKSIRLQAWFIGTPVLLLKKSNVRKCSYLPTWNGRAPTRGIKQPIFDRVWYSRLPCPNWKWAGMKFTASVVQWLKNSYTWFQVCSYYSLEVMCD